MKRFVIVPNIFFLLCLLCAVGIQSSGDISENTALNRNQKLLQEIPPLVLTSFIYILKENQNILADHFLNLGSNTDNAVEDTENKQTLNNANKKEDITENDNELTHILFKIDDILTERMHMSDFRPVIAEVSSQLLDKYCKKINFTSNYFEKLILQDAVAKFETSNEKPGWVKQRAAGLDTLIKYQNSQNIQQFLDEHSISLPCVRNGLNEKNALVE